jgi:hypothetical protein
MAYGILKRPSAVVRLLRGPALQLILDQSNAVATARRVAAQESTLPAVLADQSAGDVAELGGKVLVNEQDVHVTDSRESLWAPRFLSWATVELGNVAVILSCCKVG